VDRARWRRHDTILPFGRGRRRFRVHRELVGWVAAKYLPFTTSATLRLSATSTPVLNYCVVPRYCYYKLLVITIILLFTGQRKFALFYTYLPTFTTGNNRTTVIIFHYVMIIGMVINKHWYKVHSVSAFTMFCNILKCNERICVAIALHIQIV